MHPPSSPRQEHWQVRGSAAQGHTGASVSWRVPACPESSLPLPPAWRAECLGDDLTEPGTPHQTRAICPLKQAPLWPGGLCGSFRPGPLLPGPRSLLTQREPQSAENRKEPAVFHGRESAHSALFIQRGGPDTPRCGSGGTQGFAEPRRTQAWAEGSRGASLS